MGLLTKKACWARSVGVFVSAGRLTATLIAATPAGRKTLAQATVALEGKQPGQILDQWLGANLTPAQRRQVPIWIGLGAEQTFFATRYIDADQPQMPTPETLFPGINTSSQDGVVTDGLSLKLHGAHAYSVAACRRSIAQDMVRGIGKASLAHCRLMPAPWGLLTLKPHRKFPRGWKAHIRLQLSPNEGLAMLVMEGRPLLWRCFVPGKEGMNGAISAIRHLQIYAAQRQHGLRLSGIVVAGSIKPEFLGQLQDETGLEVVSRPDENSGEADYSRAMALAARQPNLEGPDLLRPLHLAPTLGQMFPRKMTAGLALAVLVFAAFLWQTLWALGSETKLLNRQNLSHVWAVNKKTSELEQERKQLSDEVASVQKFLASRVIWSNYLRDLPTRLPQNSCLTGFNGSYEFVQASSAKAAKKDNRMLTLRGIAQFQDRNSAPREIDAFLESLREVSLLKKDFPLVNLAEVRWKKEASGDVAIFTILAMPKQKPVSERAGAPGGKDK
jgi:Tfp pilus assembly protein PilN